MRDRGLYDTIIPTLESVTHRVCETHMAIYRIICLTVEDNLFCEESATDYGAG